MSGASQRGSSSKHFPKDNKLADRSMDKGAGSYRSGPASAPSVRPIPNPPKAVAKSYAYKDGVGKTGLQ